MVAVVQVSGGIKGTEWADGPTLERALYGAPKSKEESLASLL